VTTQAQDINGLKETSAKKEAECIDLATDLAQQRKVANSRRLELELVQKTTKSEREHLTKKIEQQQKTLSQTTSFLTDEEKKLQLANDKLGDQRTKCQEADSKITYLQCDLDLAKESIETLEAQKNMLIKQRNED
jgi:hypothetical protein